MKKPVLIFLSIVLMTACSRDKVAEEKSDPYTVMKTDKVMNMLTELVHLSEATRNHTLNMTGYVNDTAGCPTVTWDTSGTARIITIDYGYCLCQDAEPRGGNMTISYAGDDHAAGTAIYHAFGLSSLLSISGYSIDGNQSIKNTGLNARGHFCQKLQTNITIHAPSDYMIVSADLDLEWQEGWDTPTLMDDVLLVTGQFKASYDPLGSHAENTSSLVNIQVPLEKRASCRYFSSGLAWYKVQGMPDHLVYYGAGACDNQAVLQVNNKVETIQLLD